MARTVALNNPSFEANTGAPTGWTRFQWTPSAGAGAQNNPGFAFDGSNTFYTGSLRNGSLNGVYQDFSILPEDIGQFMRFSFRGYRDGDATAGLWQARPIIVFFDGGGTEISNTFTNHDTAVNGADNWGLYAHDAQIPEGAASCRVVAAATRIAGGSGFSNLHYDLAECEITDTPPTYRHWRVRITGVRSGDQSFLREVRFKKSLADVDFAAGGTASASSEDGTNVASRAFDADVPGDIENFWRSSATDLSDGEAWIAYDFGAGNEFACSGVILNSTSGTSNQQVTDFDVQGSNDGSSWTTVWSVSTTPWINNNVFINPTIHENVLVNGGFETGDKTGWTDGTNGGSMAVATATTGGDAPQEGTYCLNTGSSGTDPFIYQDFDLDAAFTAAEIDAGNLTCLGLLWGINWSSDNDEAEITIEFLDGVGANISSTTAGGAAQSWTQHYNGLGGEIVPSGTRLVRVWCQSILDSGATANVAHDNVQLYFQIPPVAGTQASGDVGTLDVTALTGNAEDIDPNRSASGDVGTLTVSAPEGAVPLEVTASGDIGTITITAPAVTFTRVTQAGLISLAKISTSLRLTQTGAIILAKSPAETRITQMGLLVLAKGAPIPLQPSPLSLMDQGRDDLVRQPLINMYSEPTPQGPTGDARFGRPGLYSVAQYGGGPIRATFLWKGFRITVSGQSVFLDGTNIGTVPNNDDLPVRWAISTTECVIVTDGRAYYVNEEGVTLIENSLISSVRDVAFLAGRFIYVTADRSGTFYYSELSDAQNVAGLNFASAESDPDPITGVAVIGDSLMFVGEETTEWWYASADPDAPFQRSRGRRYSTGCKSIYSIVEVANTLAFVGDDRVVYSAEAVPRPISNYDVANRLRKVQDENLSRITAFTVTFGGHEFYVVNLPDDQGSWAYDFSNNTWAEWKSWNKPRFRIDVADENFMGDAYSGAICGFDGQTFTDLGDPLERICSTFAPIRSGSARNWNLILMTKRGVGLVYGPGANPKVEMRFTDNPYGEGTDWSYWQATSLGLIGQTDRSATALWTQLGQITPPGRLYQFRCTDPIEFTPHQVKFNEQRG